MPLDRFSNFNNYYDASGTYVVRTKSEDFIKLINEEDEDRPNSGLLIVRRLDTLKPAWTPVCAYNFDMPHTACHNLGFSRTDGFRRARIEDINNGEWEIRDGWQKTWDYGKYPYTEITSNYKDYQYGEPNWVNHEPFRRFYKL